MALTFNSGLASTLASAATKLAWANSLQSALGNTRRVRCFKDTNAAAADPSVTGTEFLNIGATGTLNIVGGNIMGLGTLSGFTIRNAADLATGASVLRIEGGGNYVQGTLGLAGSNADFIFSANPSASTAVGLAFAPTAGALAPALLDSGTGPLSPSVDFANDATIVVGARLCDWSSGSRVVVGTIYWNFREPNVVMEQPWMAREYGDVRRYRTPDGSQLQWGTGGDSYVIGGDILLTNKINNAQANVPLQEVEIRMMPDTTKRWNTYPFKGAFNSATDCIVPPAHKFELINNQGNIIDVIEMYSTRDANNTPGSGWPVNDPRQNINWHDSSPYKPVQGYWSCRQVHAWKSHKPKVHSLLGHFMPGVESDALDVKNVIGFASDPLQWPVITGTGLENGLGSYRVSPKWSRAKAGGLDTNIIDTNFLQIDRDYYTTQAIGYGFEPGATGKHTIYMSPGGSRHDRAAWPHVYMQWASNPAGSRIHGNVPYRDLVDHWNMNYYNHHHHYWRDVNQGLSIQKSKILAGSVCYNGTYYSGGNENFKPDLPNNAIDLLSVQNGAGMESAKFDKNGHDPVNQYMRDLMHNQSNAALGAIATVSPRLVLAASHSFAGNILSNFAATSGTISKYDFTGRAHAWYVLNFVYMWMVANNHPNCFTVAEIEGLFATHLNQVVDQVKSEVDQQNTVYGVAMSRYGVPLLQQNNSDGTFSYVPQQSADFPDSKAFYFTQAFVLMKQCGLYDRMRAYSPKTKAGLDFIMQCLNTNAIGCIVDGQGRFDRYGYWRSQNFTTGGIAGMPATWAGLYPANGQEDWIHYSDGSMAIQDNPVDNTNTKHFRAQWIWAMATYFPELNIPRLSDATTLINGWYSQVEANRANTYWTFRFAMMGKLKAPDYVGAPT